MYHTTKEYLEFYAEREKRERKIKMWIVTVWLKLNDTDHVGTFATYAFRTNGEFIAGLSRIKDRYKHEQWIITVSEVIHANA